MPTRPVNEFTWIGHIPGGAQGGTVTWDSEFTPADGYDDLPPLVTPLPDAQVLVSGKAGVGATVRDPVSPGILVLTPTITDKNGSSVMLGSITLEILLTGEVVVVGDVLACGVNVNGRLGDGTLVRRLTPVSSKYLNDLSLLREFISISAGTNNSLAVRSDGTVWAWGYNNYGKLGDGTTTTRTAGVPVLASANQGDVLTGVTAVEAGLIHSLALKDEKVFAWGANSSFYGLGDGTSTNKLFPVNTIDDTGAVLSNIVAISSFCYHSLALKGDGSVWAWGRNVYGELGNATTTDKLYARRSKVSSTEYITNVVAIAAGYNHSLALDNDGYVWACGYGPEGLVGDGTNVTRNVFVKVKKSSTEYLSDIIAIDAGYYHSLALDSYGTVWAWGENFSGEVGNGTQDIVALATPVLNITGVTAVSAGNRSSFALKAGGTVWAWGDNTHGQLGNNSTTSPIFIPTQVKGINDSGFLADVIAISAGSDHSLFLKRTP